MWSEDRPVTRQVVKIVHDDGKKQVQNLNSWQNTLLHHEASNDLKWDNDKYENKIQTENIHQTMNQTANLHSTLLT